MSLVAAVVVSAAIGAAIGAAVACATLVALAIVLLRAAPQLIAALGRLLSAWISRAL